MKFSIEWPADDYAIGSYIQAKIADNYLSKLNIHPNDKVLDIGCGEETYTKKIAQSFPLASILGVDSSISMLTLAQAKTHSCPNLTFEHNDASTMNYHNRFNAIISFWCLQWIQDIHKTFANIYHALKPSGNFFAILPTGDDAFFQTYLQVKNTEQFAFLENFIPPIDYQKFEALPQILAALPFHQTKITRQPIEIELPGIDIYQKFVAGIPFFDNQLSPTEVQKIRTSMVNTYQQNCIKNHNNHYLFSLRLYVIEASKN